MSKSKKKVVTTKKTTAKTVKTSPTVSRKRASSGSPAPAKMTPLIFDKTNYMLMLAGIGLIALGLLLMQGGAMPTPDVWDESLIYSSRRIVLAPFVILLGLGVEIYAIFKKTNHEPKDAEASA
ncbi:MAG: DUF3098 domain-containing protein [Bacteroidota bacterium]